MCGKEGSAKRELQIEKYEHIASLKKQFHIKAEYIANIATTLFLLFYFDFLYTIVLISSAYYVL